jgi:hypothetical protein
MHRHMNVKKKKKVSECVCVCVWSICGMILRGEHLSQYHFVHHKSHMGWPRTEPMPAKWEAGN